jgi:hypothetical protein
MLALENEHIEALALLLANGAYLNAASSAEQVTHYLFTIIHEFD